LQLNGFGHSFEIRSGDGANPRPETFFADRRELIRHSFALLAVQRDIGLAGIQPGDIARQWNDLNPIEMLVGSIIADDYSRTTLPDFAADGGIKVDPPTSPRFIGDITAGGLNPLARLGFTRFVGGHETVALRQIRMEDVRAHEVLDELADSFFSDDPVQAVVNAFFDCDRQFSSHRGPRPSARCCASVPMRSSTSVKRFNPVPYVWRTVGAEGPKVRP
jgi:hypothetical protein